MFVPAVRLALVLTGIALGLAMLDESPVASWLGFAGAALLAVGHWRYGTVWLAFRSYRRGEFDRMERQLMGTPTPAYLQSKQRAYCHFLRGVVHRRHSRLAEARHELQLAADGTVRCAITRSFFYSQLAEAALTAGDVPAARAAIMQARQLQPSGFVEAVLRDLEHNLPAA